MSRFYVPDQGQRPTVPRMIIKTADGDLALQAQGVTFKPFALHGKAEAQTWQWSQVRRVAMEDGGRRVDRENLAFGLIGALFRSSRVTVVLSLDDQDLVFTTKQDLAEV